MSSPREWAELQLAADHANVVRAVRRDGIVSLVWGVLLIAADWALFHNGLTTLIGLALVASGTWQIASPRPAGFLASGSLIGLIGVLNIGGTLLSVANGEATMVSFVVIGVWQCVWAGQMFARHRRFAPGFSRSVHPATAERARAMLTSLREASPRSAPDVIEFVVTGLGPRRCRARLDEHGALCVIGGGDDVRLLSRAQFHVERTGRVLIGSGARVRVRIGEKQMVGTMPEESWERFTRWSGHLEPVAAAA